MKHKHLILIPLLGFLVGCTPNSSSSPSTSEPSSELTYDTYDDSLYSASIDEEGYTLIDFYTLNDFHGALVYDQDATLPGISKLNTFLNDKRDDNPGGTVLIANGDMWQGSADSNLTRGKIVNHTLNYMGFAAMTLGNHEFDWSVNVIKENKEVANFPYLGENIFYKDSGEKVDFVDESPIIERDGVKIGIIGTIGSDLERTIQGSLISDLSFELITEYVTNEASRLRDDGANIVVLATHDSWFSNIDAERSPIVNENIVDAVFTGHQHIRHEEFSNGVPILQGRAYGRDVQYVRLGYNKTSGSVKVVTGEVLKDIANLELENDATSEKIYNHFYEEYNIGTIKNEQLGTIINRDMNIRAVANLAVRVMAEEYASDEVVGAFHHVNGGIRAEFKMGPITYGNVYQAFPFDNEIYLVRLLGRRLKSLSASYAAYWTTPKTELEDLTYYYIVTINYLHELNGSPVYNEPFENMFTYPRDLLADYIRSSGQIDGGAYY